MIEDRNTGSLKAGNTNPNFLRVLLSSVLKLFGAGAKKSEPEVKKSEKEKHQPEEHRCSETTRAFPTPEAARASEARFREVQAQCDAGQVPELRLGDVIYIDTELYLSHGRDDFRGGMGEVIELKPDRIGGQPVTFVRVAQQEDTLHSWRYLAPMQKKLRQEFGKNWARPDPDFRPEFNEW